MKEVVSNKAPKAIGPYSQAIVSNGHIYCSGQLPIDPTTSEVVAGGISEQTEQVLKNLKAVLEFQNSGFEKVVKVTAYLVDMAEFPQFNAVYAKYFKFDPKPARATIGVSALPKNVRVEIELIAEE
jgi:2-iminobutanoate/2-iminopropanoate deaminase